jgi:ABC-type multidrug transport system fused ATPase/permease subunit
MRLITLIWKTLASSEKIKYGLHILFSIINTFFETFLIAMVVPLTQIIMKKQISFFFIKDLNFLDKLDYEQQVALSLILLILIYLIKNGFFAFFISWQYNYTSKFEMRIAKKLFSTYVLQPYPFHLAKSSGVLINKINIEVGTFNSALKSICNLSSEILVLVAISICLLIYEPLGTSVVIFFALLIFLLGNFYLKSKVRLWGEKRFIHQGLANRDLIQSLEGIKEIKVMGLEHKVITNFFRNISTSILWRTKWEVVSNFPRIIFEIIAVVSFGLLIFVLMKFSNSDNLIEITALFLAATFRLMPSLTRITTSFTTFQNQYVPVLSIIEDLNLKNNELIQNDTDITNLNFENKIQFKNLHFKHQNTEKYSLENISFEISKGNIIGIIGTSGSGKTTLADSLIGLLKPNKGEIVVDDKIIDFKNIKQWQKKIGYVPQTIFLSDETVRENIAYGEESSLIDEIKVNNCIKLANLQKFINELPQGLDTVIGEKGIRISGGQRQRIAIARTLYLDPEILIFDEATSALDPKNESEIISNILSLKGSKTIIIIAHKFSLIKNCDNIIVLDDGKLIKQGKYNEIF